MELTREDIQVVSRMVLDLCGIVLDESKDYLIKGRLSSVATEAGCKSFSELYYRTRHGKDEALRNKIVDAITTRETLFFRDTSPFDALQHKAIPDLIDAKTASGEPKRLHIWSAACSTGQEPYSIAMVLHELLPQPGGWDIKILGTDIADAAISQASKGEYAEHEIRRGMPPHLLSKHFMKNGSTYRIKDELRAQVQFRRINLLEPFTGIGRFDVIFCRNVVIYFGAEDRKTLFHRLTKQLHPNGYLFVGSSESLTDLGPQFQPQKHCRAIFYQPARMPTPA
jgi:chemotaxis protein methyltransferase CheR